MRDLISGSLDILQFIGTKILEKKKRLVENRYEFKRKGIFKLLLAVCRKSRCTVSCFYSLNSSGPYSGAECIWRSCLNNSNHDNYAGVC